jgi:hypothetical protein
MNSPRVAVLAYHSGNIRGQGYAVNDHTALALDLRTLQHLRIPVLSAWVVVQHWREGRWHQLPQRSAVITMDDGYAYDFEAALHPVHGPQTAMIDIVRSQHTLWQRWRGKPAPAVATAFVIASPAARAQICQADGIDTQWMSERHWQTAQRTGYLDIGTHSWNHVHPSTQDMAEHPEWTQRFDAIADWEQAHLQCVTASDYVRQKTKHPAASLFAYPEGRYSDFWDKEFLPRQDAVVAAFTTDPQWMTQDTSIWAIPRFVCGEHWRSVEELAHLLQH